MSITDIKTLREKVEASPKSSYELDLDIMKVLKYADPKSIVDGDSYKLKNSRHSSKVITYSNSIDAAIRLIPADFKLVELSGYVGPWQVKISKKLQSGVDLILSGSHEYPAMAIVIASLRAMEYNESNK
jgi:hypothetical protein